jgi:hypothetical protein
VVEQGEPDYFVANEEDISFEEKVKEVYKVRQGSKTEESKKSKEIKSGSGVESGLLSISLNEDVDAQESMGSSKEP